MDVMVKKMLVMTVLSSYVVFISLYSVLPGAALAAKSSQLCN
jgi:hypothetical protein